MIEIKLYSTILSKLKLNFTNYNFLERKFVWPKHFGGKRIKLAIDNYKNFRGKCKSMGRKK